MSDYNAFDPAHIAAPDATFLSEDPSLLIDAEIELLDVTDDAPFLALDEGLDTISHAVTEPEEEDVAIPSSDRSATSKISEIGIYSRALRRIPLLTESEEYALITQWQQQATPKAAERLITTHLRLIAKIATRYRGYGLPLEDLISEGLVGMMHALNKFDISKGFRLSTYAAWWIKAAIKDHILRSWSLVRLGTNASQKRLFFSLRSTRAKLLRETGSGEELHLEQRIATHMGLPLREVTDMCQRMSGGDMSLNAPRTGDEEGDWMERLEDHAPNQETTLMRQDQKSKHKALLEYALGYLTPREYDIFTQRYLKEPPPTLGDLAEVYSLSRERVRQIESKTFEKVQTIVRRRAAELRLSARLESGDDE